MLVSCLRIYVCFVVLVVFRSFFVLNCFVLCIVLLLLVWCLFERFVVLFGCVCCHVVLFGDCVRLVFCLAFGLLCSFLFV